MEVINTNLSGAVEIIPDIYSDIQKQGTNPVRQCRSGESKCIRKGDSQRVAFSKAPIRSGEIGQSRAGENS